MYYDSDGMPPNGNYLSRLLVSLDKISANKIN